TCRKVGFSPKVLQDADIERTVIQSVAAGLGVALLPDQVKKLPHDSVVFRELNPSVKTESCIAWQADNPSIALKAYINIASDRGASTHVDEEAFAAAVTRLTSNRKSQ